MTTKEITRQRNKELGEILKPHGFKYDSKAYQFIKTKEDGYWGVSAALGDYSPLYTLQFSFTIRVNQVEQIYQHYCRILSAYQKYSSTLIISYDLFKEKRYFEYHLYNQEELSIALRDFRSVLENQVLPFFQRHSDLKYLFHLVRSGEIRKIDITAVPDNYIHWLIISKLGGHENLRGLAGNYFEDFWKENEVHEDRERVARLLRDLKIQ